jgi:hypothetical protein
VEADFSTINYKKDDHRSALTSFSLEGILHLRQLEKLRQTFNDITLQEGNQHLVVLSSSSSAVGY